MATRGGRSAAWREALVIACAGALLTPTEAGAALVLTPSSTSRVVALGEDRTAEINLVFTASEALPAEVTVVVTPVELATSDGLQFQATPIQPHATVATDRLAINVRVALDAADSLHAGRYDGIVAVRAGVGTSAQTALGAVVTDAPASGWVSWPAAAIALLLGAAGGALLKWLTETASKLAAVANRLAEIDVVLADVAGFVPRTFAAMLREVRARLAHQDASGAAAAAATISDEKLLGILAVGQTAKGLSDALPRQRGRIDEIAGLGPERRAMMFAVVDTESREISAAVDRAWPDPTKAGVALLERGVAGYERFLKSTSATPPAVEEEKVRELLALFTDAKWEDALKQLGTLAKDDPTLLGDEVEPTTEALTIEEPEPPSPQPKTSSFDAWLAALADWLTRHYALATQVIVVVAVALTGLLFLFDADKTFATESVEDFLKLAAYGFGAQATGVTVAQLGGKLGSVGPKI